MSQLPVLLKRLCQANRDILAQKLGLMKALVSRNNPNGARHLYQTVCPVVRASMGQHMRHSLDHVDRAVNFEPGSSSIHYDLRQRDTPEERDWELMAARIQHTQQQLTELSRARDREDEY